MPQNSTYGIKFPFADSTDGRYFALNTTSTDEIRTDLVHLLLTRKGSRYYLPDFGTRLLEYIFEPLDGPTFGEIESEIRDAVTEYIPGIQITNLTITDASMDEQNKGTFINDMNERVYSVPNIGTLEHTAKVKIEYLITDEAFGASDFVIINV
jgi:phage baseplate assembly protein W